MSASDDPQVWPQCSECGVAYVHRRGLSFTDGWRWYWQQDCKHGRKGSPQPAPVLVNADGPLPNELRGDQ